MCEMDALEHVLAQIRTSGFVLDADPIIEARRNTYVVALSADEASELSVTQVTAFLHDARSALAATASPDSPDSLRFYAWFDEMAGQLRLSVSSANELPFGGTIRTVADPAVVASQCLESDYIDGIPWSSLAPDEEVPEPLHNPLDVFMTDLMSTA